MQRVKLRPYHWIPFVGAAFLPKGTLNGQLHPGYIWYQMTLTFIIGMTIVNSLKTIF